MSLRKAKDELLYVDKVFAELGIDYFIVGGVLLGCFRHGGFIPWDDDIDILVRESDMYRLSEVFPDKVRLISTDTITSNHYGPFQHFAVWDGAVKVDVWPWKKKNEYMQTCIGDFPLSVWYPIRRAKFEDIVVSVPNDPIYVIEYNFGKDWRTKVKKTHSDLSIWCVLESEVIEDTFVGQIPALEDVLVGYK